MPANKSLSIRLSVENAETVRRALQQIGEQGTAALKQMEAGAAGGAQSMVRLERSLQAIENRLNPIAKAERDLARDIGLVNQAVATGARNEEQAKTATEQLTAAHQRKVAALKLTQGAVGDVTAALGAHAKASGLSFQQTQILQSGLINTFQSIAAGMDPMRTLITQTTQTAPAFISARAALNPLTLGLVAFAGAAALGVAKAIDLSSEARSFGVSIRAMGKDAQTTTAQLHAMVEAMRDQGIGKADARGAITSLIRTPGLSSADAARAAGFAPDAAAAFGSDVGTMTKALAELSTQGYAAIKKLDEAYNFLTVAQSQQIRTLAEQGNKAGAVAIAYEAMGGRIKGAARDALSPAAAAMNDLGRSWDGFVSAIANSEPVLKLLQQTAGWLGDISNQVKGTGGGGAAGGIDTNKLGFQVHRDEAERLLKQRNALSDRLRTGDVVDAKEYVDTAAEIRRLDAEVTAMEGIAKRYKLAMDQLPASGKPGPWRDSAALPPPPIDPKAKQLSDYAADVDRQKRMIGVSPGGQSIMAAQLAGEAEAAAKGYVGLQALEHVALKVREAKIQLAVSIGQVAGQMAIEDAQAGLVADAYLRSAAAGQAAEAARQAAIDSFNTGADLEQRKRALIQKQVNEGLVGGAKEVTVLRDQAAAAEAMADASAQGAEAEGKAELAAKITNATREIGIAIANATGEKELKLRLVREGMIDTLTKIDAKEKETAGNRAMRAAQQETQIANMEAAAAQLNNVDDRQKVTLAIDRQRQLNQLTATYKDDVGTIGRLINQWDLTQAAREQARFFSEIRSKAEGISNDISQFLVDGFVNANAGGRSMFQNLWEGVVAGAKRTAANIAAEFLKQAIFLPVITQVVGSAPGAFGIASPGGQAGSGGGIGGLFGSLGNLSSGYNALSGLGNLSLVNNPFATAGNGAMNLLGLGGGIGGGAGAASAGALAGGAHAAALAGTGAEAVTLAPALSGLSATGIGAGIALAGILAMTLLGGKKSVGPNATSIVGTAPGYGSDGGLRIINSAADNGGDVGRATSLATAGLKGLNDTLAKLGGTVTALGNVSTGYFKDKLFVDDTGAGGSRTYQGNTFDSPDEAVKGFVLAALQAGVRNGGISGLSQAQTAAINTSDAGTLAARLDWATGFYDKLGKSADGVASYQKAFDDLDAAMVVNRANVEEMHLAMQPVIDDYERQKKALRETFSAGLGDQLAQATGTAGSGGAAAALGVLTTYRNNLADITLLFADGGDQARETAKANQLLNASGLAALRAIGPEGLASVLESLAGKTDTASLALQAMIPQAAALQRGDFTLGLQAQIMQNSGLGVFNQLGDLALGHSKNLYDAGRLGIGDTGLVDQQFSTGIQAALGSITDPALLAKIRDYYGPAGAGGAIQGAATIAAIAAKAFDDLAAGTTAATAAARAALDAAERQGRAQQDAAWQQEYDRNFADRTRLAIDIGRQGLQLLDDEIAKKQAATEASQRYVDGIGQYLDQLKLGEYSVLDPKGKFDEAERQYRATLAAAQGGDSGARDRLQGSANAYFAANQGYYASSNPAVMAAVQADMAGMKSVAALQLDAAKDGVDVLRDQRRALERQIQLLEGVNPILVTGFANVTDALAAMNGVVASRGTDARPSAIDAFAGVAGDWRNTLTAAGGTVDKSAYATAVGRRESVLDKATSAEIAAIGAQYYGLTGSSDSIRAAIKAMDRPVLGMAEGGLVTGGIAGRDSVPALLMPGERVLTVQQNRRYEAGNDNSEMAALRRQLEALTGQVKFLTQIVAQGLTENRQAVEAGNEHAADLVASLRLRRAERAA